MSESFSKPQVWSKRAGAQVPPKDAIYVGRPTKWGSPFVLPEKCDATKRAAVLRQYEAWIVTRPDIIAAAKAELVGKHLVCWCAPKACHADVLLRIANE